MSVIGESMTDRDPKAWIRQRISLLVEAREIIRNTKGLTAEDIKDFDMDIDYFQRKLSAPIRRIG